MFIKLLIAFLGIRDLRKRTGLSYDEIGLAGIQALRIEIQLLGEDTPEGRRAIRFVRQRQASGAYSGLKGDRLRLIVQTDMAFAKIVAHQTKV